MTFVHLIGEHFRPSELFTLAFIWGVTLIGAGLTFVIQPYHGEPRTVAGFVRFLLPVRVLTASQTRLDLAFALTTKCLRALWRPLLVSNLAVASVVYRGLSRPALNSAPTLPRHGPSGPEAVLVIVVAIVIADFFDFFGHYLCHRSKFLWEFHKVHHSALSLTPLTEHRFHPLEEVWNLGWISLGVGTWIALAARYLAVPLSDTTILGLDGYYAANALSFFHLRHSHIYMRYPAWLERHFLSPAQHQLHHSRELRHWDRNLGLLLSCWDRLFGTFALSEPTPITNLGLDTGQERYLTVPRLLFMPLLAHGHAALVRRGRQAPVVLPAAVLADAALGQEPPDRSPLAMGEAEGALRVG